MDQLQSFLQDRWYLILAAVIVLLIVIKMVKTVVKWVIVIVLLAGLIIYGAQYKDEVTSLKDGLAGTAAETVKDKALQAIAGEAKDAKYTKNADGSYTVSTKSLKLEGKPDDANVKVTFLNQTITLPLEGAVQRFVDDAKKNG